MKSKIQNVKEYNISNIEWSWDEDAYMRFRRSHDSGEEAKLYPEDAIISVPDYLDSESEEFDDYVVHALVKEFKFPGKVKNFELA